jgi:glycosyltransferase involved in cell wall biosynthesis
MTLWVDLFVWLALVAWTAVFVLGLMNWVFVRDVSRRAPREPQRWPSVSIISPARNEERLIGEAVASFCAQDYPDFEVIVIDDRSTDATPRILADLQRRYSNLKVVPGADPPPGWLGKPNALQHGWRACRGEWIVVVDADVVYRTNDVLRRGVAFTLGHKAQMGVLQPRTEPGSVLETILMSGFNFFIFCVVPLFLVSRTRSGVFATGSPVFNLIAREALEAGDGFAFIKGDVLDDAAIGHRVKAAGFRQAVAFAGPLISRRMYHGTRDAIHGFTKIIFPTIRKLPWLLPLSYVVGVAMSLMPYIVFLVTLVEGDPSVPAGVALVLMHATLAMLAIRLRQPWYIIVANPIRELLWWWIFARSFASYWCKGLEWRGRTYSELT